MTELVHREKAHVLPLDSIRGIAATSVVIHHLLLMPTFLAAFPHNAWINCSFFRSAWLLVDLFFVLSGMVMALSYVENDFTRFSLREFMVRRLARVYPLHIVMLLANLVFRLLRIGLVMAGVVVAAPAAFEVNNAYSFGLNVLLLHSMGFIDYLSWNAPSWSISVEFYTYLVFGLIVLIALRMRSLAWFYVLSGLLAVGSLVFIIFVLEKKSIELQTDFGLLRCFVGFFLGVLMVRIVDRLPAKPRPAAQGALQFVAMIASIVLVSLAEANPAATFLAPVMFAIFLGSLLAFPDALLVPRILVAKPLIWLGRRSYSIYMVHALVVLLAEYFVRGVGAGRIAALDSIWAGLPATLNLVVSLAAVLAVSHLTYLYVEIPGGRLLRNAFGSPPDFAPSPARSARLSN
ncbi:acyltransferase [Bradyrhizobium yuanmingense]|uniref:Peptidoglycan/LPS O-acetylase OafA/YrhL n=1 Tax=Bradyrhizobium yuanmingense TaxID=108015 RepID=A0A1C3WTI9_9BRAD|nr:MULTISPECIES: acyltransferase [Bradyrhizobium]TWI23434.1 peptidoglycan/LPS O-acetylase OafA/YrhL [Bradyrhizobium yuanmingense]UWU85826.1 acyltransferase [Bradyrhizobium sp. CB1024]SCB43357.1 Peptidoglycan/LPS O-acetylase OafA/YrhL, contains acyltransferase and SGNH-hydrolase domains [Bradyrhizobium yuanmingense]